MRYLYKCGFCNREAVVNKPMRNSGTPERCPNCEKVMKRVFEPLGGIKTGDGVK